MSGSGFPLNTEFSKCHFFLNAFEVKNKFNSTFKLFNDFPAKTVSYASVVSIYVEIRLQYER